MFHPVEESAGPFMPRPYILQSPVYTPEILESLERVNELGICPSRLWNLAVTSRYETFELSSLASLACESINKAHFRQVGHNDCTSEACHFTEDNSTLVEQLHVCCNQQECSTLEFPSLKLVNGDNHSAWHLHNEASGAGFSTSI